LCPADEVIEIAYSMLSQPGDEEALALPVASGVLKNARFLSFRAQTWSQNGEPIT
jgi:hypothetical protein